MHCQVKLKSTSFSILYNEWLIDSNDSVLFHWLKIKSSFHYFFINIYFNQYINFFAIFTLHWKCNQISLNISVLMILTDDCVLGAGKRTELYGFMSLEKCLKRNLASALDEKTSFFFNSFFFFFFFVFRSSFFQLLSFTTNLVFPLFNFCYFILSFPMVCKKAIWCFLNSLVKRFLLF